MGNNKGKGKAKAKGINKSTIRKSKRQQFKLVPTNQRQIVEWQGKEEIGTKVKMLFEIGPFKDWHAGTIKGYDMKGWHEYWILFEDGESAHEMAHEMNAYIMAGKFEVITRAPRR